MISIEPGQHVTIEFTPFTEERAANNKHGLTHLVRVYQRESNGAVEANPLNARQKGLREPGKIKQIFEQEISDDGTGEGISRALRRFSTYIRR